VSRCGASSCSQAISARGGGGKGRRPQKDACACLPRPRDGGGHDGDIDFDGDGEERALVHARMNMWSQCSVLSRMRDGLNIVGV
jgi:hypothetical protein